MEFMTSWSRSGHEAPGYLRWCTLTPEVCVVGRRVFFAPLGAAAVGALVIGNTECGSDTSSDARMDGTATTSGPGSSTSSAGGASATSATGSTGSTTSATSAGSGGTSGSSTTSAGGSGG